MDLRDTTVGVLVAITVISLAGPWVLGGQPTAGAGAPAQTQPSAECDYAGLYDEAIASVVQIRQQRGQGSGFVFESFDNGTSFVVTNQHVLGDASDVEVAFRDGETRRATVLGTAAGADLGVVEVNDTPDYVSSLPLAADSPQPGTKVAALGSPFGLRGSITHGLVSSTDRSMPTDRGFRIPDVIQTDAPINPGNSGGPLVTCDGDVVGVNTAGIPAQRAENIGFAVSARLVERVVPELIATGEVNFAYLGVRTVTVTPAVADANDLNESEGVMVVEAVSDSPADGVFQEPERWETDDRRRIPVGGDVIVGIQNTSVVSAEDLSGFLATRASPGDSVEVTVLRDGERRTVTVTLGERPAAEAS